MVVIDGIFLTRQTTGLQRFALNIVREMDTMASPGEMQLLVPAYCEVPAGFQNIEVVRYGRRKGYIWEQTDLARYLLKMRASGLFLENAVPLLYRHGTVVLHDISLKANPAFYDGTLKGRLTMCCWRTIYRLIMRSDMKIVTVSEFSKAEMIRQYDIEDDRITVVHNGWQHMDAILPDESILTRLGLAKGAYYFTLGTAAPNKNLAWVTRAAANNPDETFVIAGKGTDRMGETGPNVMTAGYLDDREVKALMMHCRAFLFPTLYEGFGLPPMEALASGAERIIISDTPCMREIYGDIAGYINPHEYSGIRLLQTAPDRDAICEFLQGYSWHAAAERLMGLL